MATIDQASLADLHAQISRLRIQFPNSWREHTEAHVHAWVSSFLPSIPGRTIHVRLLEDTSTGRHYARVRVTVQPLFMDVTISKDTNGHPSV